MVLWYILLQRNRLSLLLRVYLTQARRRHGVEVVQMLCAHCGFANPEGMHFCGRCGTQLPRPCPACGCMNPTAHVFCGQCGSRISAQPFSPGATPGERSLTPQVQPAAQSEPSLEARHTPAAERRQLTVLFCDLVESTALAGRLDPEDYREVVRAYQNTCAEIIQRFEGHIAQYLGDGILVYFGYPQAHEDDVQRAVRTGLGVVEAMDTLNRRLEPRQGVRLAVRVGIHTGLVVVGEMGGDGRQEQLALGDTPNIAARLQGLAAPDTVLISAATQRLIQGYLHLPGSRVPGAQRRGHAPPGPPGRA